MTISRGEAYRTLQAIFPGNIILHIIWFIAYYLVGSFGGGYVSKNISENRSFLGSDVTKVCRKCSFQGASLKWLFFFAFVAQRFGSLWQIPCWNIYCSWQPKGSPQYLPKFILLQEGMQQFTYPSGVYQNCFVPADFKKLQAH